MNAEIENRMKKLLKDAIYTRSTVEDSYLSIIDEIVELHMTYPKTFSKTNLSVMIAELLDGNDELYDGLQTFIDVMTEILDRSHIDINNDSDDDSVNEDTKNDRIFLKKKE